MLAWVEGWVCVLLQAITAFIPAGDTKGVKSPFAPITTITKDLLLYLTAKGKNKERERLLDAGMSAN